MFTTKLVRETIQEPVQSVVGMKPCYTPNADPFKSWSDSGELPPWDIWSQQALINSNWRYARYYERIAAYRGGPRTMWKPIEHYKRTMISRRNLIPSTVTCRDNDFGAYDVVSWNFETVDPLWGVELGSWGDPGNPAKDLPVMVVDRATDGGFIPPPSNLGLLVQKSLDSMMPGIKEELSLLNSIYELKDFKSLPQQLKRAFRAGDTIVNQTKRLLNGKPLAAVARELAGGFLQWKFNLSPLVSDVFGVHQALTNVSRQINDLISRQGKSQTRHYVWVWKEFSDTENYREMSELEAQGSLHRDFSMIGTTRAYAPRKTKHSLRRQSTYTPTTFHAEIQYNYNYTQFQLAHAQVLGVLDSLGINLNPSIIWNAIPWTFCIDWLVRVSRMLEQFKTQNMEPQINIRRYLWSVKRIRSTRVSRKADVYLPSFSQVWPTPSSWVSNPWIDLPEVVETAYRRSVTLPTRAQIELSGINSSEFTLGAALVVARKRRRSH